MRTNVRALLAAAALCLGAASAQADTIHLGAILPLTGPGAVVGNQEMRGIQFAMDQANAKGGVHGDKLDVAFEDNQAKPDQSVLSFNKLVDLEHVPMIFTGYSGPSLAMAPLATRKKILLINAGAQSDRLGTASPYLVNTLPSTGDEVTVLSKWLVGQGKKTASILFENDAAGIGGRDDFVKDYRKAGGKILAQEPSQFGQTDYRPALLKLAGSNPEVLFVSITAGMVPLADQIHQMDRNFLVAGTSFFADPQAIADPTAEGFVHTQVQIDAPPELAASFKQHFGTDMDFFARQYYNAAQIILTVLDKLAEEKKPITGQSMRETLFAIKTFNGLIPMTFTSNTATVPIAISEFKGGKDVPIGKATAE